jgi:hypothetical protein
MRIKESEIRENIASHLHLLDPNLKLLAQEHHIKMSHGRSSYVDILAKDEFGCFTVIELKKSDQTARSAIQQLMKYANMLKRKNRLEESQIRCVVVSTVWRELEEAFDEFCHVSQYEFKGYSVVYNKDQPPIFQEIKPKYNEGDLSPLKNFIFFEFFSQKDRDDAYDSFLALLQAIPSCNSVLIKSNYEGNDSAIIHPSGFSWIMFSSECQRMRDEISKLPVKPLEDYHFDINGILYLWQLDGEEYELRSKILEEHVRLQKGSGEYTGLALHSLNNILSTWENDAPIGVGEMFSDALFDTDDMLAMACGFAGDHPYAFIMKTTPSRDYQFNMVRKKLNIFLKSNSRWCGQVDYVLNTLAPNDVAEIYVYNPLNFFGFIYDLKKYRSSNRIPNLFITVKRENGDEEIYQGILAWTSKVTDVVAKDAVFSSYPSLDILKIRLISQNLNDYDQNLSEIYGLTYEIFTLKQREAYIIRISEDGCYLEKVENIRNLEDFVQANYSLIDEVEHLLNNDPNSNVELSF